VHAAFPDAHPPAEVVPERDGDAERAAVKAAFAGKKWTALKPATIKAHRDVLPLLTSAAFRYYLPAWIAAAPGDADVTDAVVNAVGPVKGKLAKWQEERIGGFSAAQRKAIAAFLQQVVEEAGKGENLDAEAALAHYEK
jgi:hypothetical protein